MAVLAVQQIRKMRGGAQSHLMLCSDGNLYVVKFQNNPQHLRVLANELLASRLGEAIGLNIPPSAIVEVSDWLIQNTTELVMADNRGQQPCKAGLQYGSQFIGSVKTNSVVLDYLPEEQLYEVDNLEEFAGVLAFDKWTGNVNGRQAVFQKAPRQKRYRATFIDQGYCFCAGEWQFHDAPMRGVYPRNLVYRRVTGWTSFEPWLKRIETFPEQQLWAIAEGIPPEWYGDPAELEALVQTLLERRSKVRKLIEDFRTCNREPFPNWGTAAVSQQRQNFPEPELA